MSDDNASVDPTPDSPTTESQNSPTAKAKTPRSPVERAIVWGTIGVLLIVGAVQGTAMYGFKNSVTNVKDALNRAEAGSEGEVLTLDAAEKLMTGFWSKSDLKKSIGIQYVVYKWRGVYTSYTLLLNVGVGESNPMVLSYETNTDTSQHNEMIAEMIKPSGAAADQTSNGDDPSSSTTPGANGGSAGPGGMGPGGPGHGGPGHGGPGGPGHGGPGGPGHGGPGGRQPIDWASLDKDEDGKISKEEVPEFILRFFDHIDTNGDGFIDDEEREEMQRRRAAHQAAGGEGGRGGRPQRPGRPDSDSESDPKPDPKSSSTKPPEKSDKPASQP